MPAVPVAAFVVATLLAADVPVAAAQTPRVLPARGAARALEPATDTTPEAGSKIERTAPVVTRVMPATFQVIAVPVPEGLSAGRPVSYHIIGTGAGTILGRRTGTTDGGPVLVTIGVPATALAGPLTIAHVRFSAPPTAEVETPLELDVGLVRRIAVSPSRAQQGVGAGGRVRLSYRIANEGNAPDTVAVHVDLPPGWRRLDTERAIAIPAGKSADRSAHLSVPTTAQPATMRVGLVVRVRDEERSRSYAYVEVAGASVDRRRSGANLTAGVASVVTGDGTASSVAAAELSGRLTDSIRVHGRVVSDVDPDPAALRGLARVGYGGGGTPWYLVLDAPAWRADLGTTRVGFTSLTGASAVGTGGAVSLRLDGWSGGGMVAGRSQGSAAPARYLGLRLARAFDSVRVGATVTHLEERSAFARSLDAIGLDATTPTAFGASATGELAYRRHRGGSGLGWAADVNRRADGGGHLHLRVAAAPGGSAAFARGTRELTASGSHRITGRVTLGGALWRNSDVSSIGQSVDFGGWSFAPRLLLADRAAVSLELGGNEFESRTATTAFGSADHRIGLVLDGYWRGIFGSSRMQFSAVERSVALGGTGHVSAANRATWQGTLGSGGTWGAADLTARVEQSRVGSGYEPRRNEAQLRLRSPALAVGAVDFVLRGELHHFGWFGDRTSLEAVRMAVDAQLPWNVRLTVDTERNPLFSAFAGGSAWSTALRLARSTVMPRLFAARGSEGVVFQDLNANGRLDPGEPGFAGAVVRHGMRFAATDQRGRFTFGAALGGEPRVDVRTIPLGWIVTGSIRHGDGLRTEIGVAPTSSVRVRLRIDTTGIDRMLEVPLALARVTVRSDGNREWTAPVDAGGVAFFDALPAGRYEISLDLSRFSEPLSMTDGDASFTIGAERMVLERVLVLRTRPVRLRRIEPGGPVREPPTAESVVRWPLE